MTAVLEKETAGTAAISETELAQRIAVIKRFKELLNQQRERFYNFISVLENQEKLISDGNSEGNLAHIELEEQIISEIFSIQKVIDPMEAIYRTVTSQLNHDDVDDDVTALKHSLEDLKTKAAVQSSRNKELLSSRMSEIRCEINTLKSISPLKYNYQNFNSALLVDIEG